MKYDKMINELNEYKIEKNQISKEELFNLYLNLYNNDNSKTFDNLIAFLKKYNIIIDYTKNNYLLINKKDYNPNFDEKVSDINELIDINFPDIKYITWDTRLINDFTHHYVINNYIIIEIEKIALESIWFLLKEKYNKKYTIMTEDMFNKHKDYLFNNEDIIVIKKLIQKAPLEKINNKFNLTLEKMIVDLLKDNLYEQYQGKELEYIYLNIFNEYNINFKKLYSYAKNRGNLDKLQEILYKINVIESV